MILAIVRPDLEISVCESVGKKAALLKNFVEQLGLPAGVYHDRAENVLDDVGFDCCTARAVGPMGQIASLITSYEQTKTAFLSLDELMNKPVERPEGPASPDAADDAPAQA